MAQSPITFPENLLDANWGVASEEDQRQLRADLEPEIQAWNGSHHGIYGKLMRFEWKLTKNPGWIDIAIIYMVNSWDFIGFHEVI